jgi:hypothetical protein
MHNKTMFPSLNITGRRQRNEEWEETKKSAPRCAKCDGYVESGQQLCRSCQMRVKNTDVHVMRHSPSK